jgi:hypothetical protein
MTRGRRRWPRRAAGLTARSQVELTVDLERSRSLAVDLSRKLGLGIMRTGLDQYALAIITLP